MIHGRSLASRAKGQMILAHFYFQDFDSRSGTAEKVKTAEVSTL
jgi:hypothetical protein